MSQHEELIEFMRRVRGHKRPSTPYTRKNPPTRGTGRKIWRRLDELGFQVFELWYNPNCWNNPQIGWGTWAVAIGHRSLGAGGGMGGEYFCGWNKPADDVYLQATGAPFQARLARDLIDTEGKTDG